MSNKESTDIELDQLTPETTRLVTLHFQTTGEEMREDTKGRFHRK